MELRTVGWSLAAVIAATFGGVALFSIAADTSNRDLAVAETGRYNSQLALDRTSDAVGRARRRVAAVTKSGASKAKLNKEVAALEKEIHERNVEIEEKKLAWEKVRDEFEKAIGNVRKSKIGSQITNVEMGGVVSDRATIISVNRGSVSLENKTGVQKIVTEDLPPGLAYQLKPDCSPVLHVTPSLLDEQSAEKGDSGEFDSR